MLTVTPHTNELAKGQLGRWRSLNGFQNNATCLNAMRRELEQTGLGPRTTPALHVLAILSGVDPSSYVRLHSMLPFMSFACKKNLRTDDGGWAPAVVVSCGFLTPREHAHFCPECVKEDRETWGYSYWRRSHQLPSAFWCDQHPTQRLHFAISDHPFDWTPHHWIEREKVKPQALPEDIRDNAILFRFNEACKTMLDAGSSWDVKNVRRVLCDQAHVNRLATADGRTGPTKTWRLSDLTKEKLPGSLLQVLFPNVSCKTTGDYYNEIDDAVRSGSKSSIPTGTGLAISLLFPSVSDALKLMEQPIRHTPPKVIGKNIGKLFIQKIGNISAIAGEMNLSVDITTKLILSNRFSIYKKINQDAVSFALRDFYTGKSLTLKDACGVHGANPELVERAVWLKCAPKFRRKTT